MTHTTHHYACECREAEFKRIQEEHQIMREALTKITKVDYQNDFDENNNLIRTLYPVDFAKEALAELREKK